MSEQTKAPDTFFTVTVFWKKHTSSFDNVAGYNLDADVYYFFIWDERFPDVPAVKTVWVKHPDLISVEIEPYFPGD